MQEIEVANQESEQKNYKYNRTKNDVTKIEEEYQQLQYMVQLLRKQPKTWVSNQ